MQINENIKAPRHWPLCWEFTGHRWIPRTKGQQRGKCVHLMTSSWTLSLLKIYLKMSFVYVVILFGLYTVKQSIQITWLSVMDTLDIIHYEKMLRVFLCFAFDMLLSLICRAIKQYLYGLRQWHWSHHASCDIPSTTEGKDKIYRYKTATKEQRSANGAHILRVYIKKILRDDVFIVQPVHFIVIVGCSDDT